MYIHTNVRTCMCMYNVGVTNRRPAAQWDTYLRTYICLSNPQQPSCELTTSVHTQTYIRTYVCMYVCAFWTIRSDQASCWCGCNTYVVHDELCIPAGSPLLPFSSLPSLPTPPHSSPHSCPFSMARDCRLQLEELQGSQKDQVLQAERALEEFRAQSEASTSTMLSQMRREVCVRMYTCA